MRPPNRTMLRRTLALLTVCGIVAFIVLAARLYKIQIIDHDRYESLAIEQQVRGTTLTAERGTIYDRDGQILAMSASVETVYISPAEIKLYEEDVELIAANLSRILGVDYESIMEKASDTTSWYKTIALKVEQDVADQVRDFKNQYDLKSVKIEPDTKRYYPYGDLACHIVGFVGTDNYGLGGVEARYDDVLTGVDGRIVRAKNSAGTDMLFTNFEDYYDAEPGSSLVLTLDAAVQNCLEKHLEQAVADYDVQNGAAAIAMDVKTGAILGMVSLNDFDLNAYQDVSDEVRALIDAAESEEEKSALLYEAQQAQWRNKAISDTYEPGSTFKIITLSMALEEDLVDSTDSFYCSGHVDVPGRDPVKCWKTAGHGSQSLAQAVQHSCNTAFVNIGMRVGAETFYEYAESFGFFDYHNETTAQLTGKTGIDLQGESGSIWWSRDTFCDENNLTQLAAASFGQTFNITPLQLITAISACTNGGYLMQPYVVSEVLDAEGTVLSKTEPTVIRQVISEETSAKVCGILESVVGDQAEGTGSNAYVAGYRIGGKTGTSTNTVVEAETGSKEYIVSFVGVAPMDDPQIAVLVLLDCPSNESGVYISGGQMAAPTVGAMMADILPAIGVEPVYTENEMDIMDKAVPDIIGLTKDEATALLAGSGFTCRYIGAGNTVDDQLPAAGAVVADGSQVIIYCDASPSGGSEIVPNLEGLTYEQAVQRLGYLALYASTDNWAAGQNAQVVVSQQSIEPGTSAAHGSVIRLTLVDKSKLGRY